MQRDHKFLFSAYCVVIILFLLLHLIAGPVDAVVLVNSWHTPSLDIFFSTITNLGHGLIIVPFLLISLFQRFYFSFSVLSNALLQGVFVSLCKRILFHNALRPINFLSNLSIHKIEGVDIHRFMSFPSGHTVTIFGLCFLFSMYTKSKVHTIFFLLMASSVGLSRIYLLQHFSMDVAMGALLGVSCSMGVYYFFESVPKPYWMQGRLEIELRLKSTQKEPKFG